MFFVIFVSLILYNYHRFVLFLVFLVRKVKFYDYMRKIINFMNSLPFVRYVIFSLLSYMNSLILINFMIFFESFYYLSDNSTESCSPYQNDWKSQKAVSSSWVSSLLGYFNCVRFGFCTYCFHLLFVRVQFFVLKHKICFVFCVHSNMISSTVLFTKSVMFEDEIEDLTLGHLEIVRGQSLSIFVFHNHRLTLYLSWVDDVGTNWHWSPQLITNSNNWFLNYN